MRGLNGKELRRLIGGLRGEIFELLGGLLKGLEDDLVKVLLTLN